MTDVDSGVVDLNVVRLARLVSAIDAAARWCAWQARADEDDATDHVPLSADEKLVLEGWCGGFGKLAEALDRANRTETPDSPIDAVRVLRERVVDLVERCDREIDAGLEACETIPDLLETQGRLHALRVARRRLEGLARPGDSERPAQ